MTLTFGLGELIEIWPPIIWYENTSAMGFIPPLGNTDSSSLIVYVLTNGALVIGKEMLVVNVVGDTNCELFLIILFT